MMAWNVASLFAARRGASGPRTVFVNGPLPDASFDHKHRPLHLFPTNQVISSKYTILTFLPRNLLEQFRRIANMCVSPSLPLPRAHPL